jgi:ADP-heptose:LPS heptosyltransferase
VILAEPAIYVFRLGHLGDCLVTLPALRELERRHPQGRFKLITSRPDRAGFVPAWDVLRLSGLFDEALLYRAGSIASLVGLWFRLRRRAGRKVLYYLPPQRTRAQIQRDRVFFRWGCGFSEVRGVDHALEPNLRDEHDVLCTLVPEWARLLGAVADNSAPEMLEDFPLLRVDQNESRAAAAHIARLGDPVPLVAMGPGSKMPAKKWFLERYVEVARRILDSRQEAAVVILGGPEDRVDGEALVAALPGRRLINLAGETTLQGSAAILERCDLYVGNDTGTMHLAAVMGVRCVALFTSRDNPGKWLPVGSGHRILRRELPCSGCMLENCVEMKMRCLAEISVDEVWQAVSEALA